MSHGLSELTIEKIREVLDRYPQVQQAILHGERVRGEFHKESEIELALVGDDIDISLLFMIDNDLVDLLLPYEFDLTRFSKIKNSELKEHIEQEGLSILS